MAEKVTSSNGGSGGGAYSPMETYEVQVKRDGKVIAVSAGYTLSEALARAKQEASTVAHTIYTY